MPATQPHLLGAPAWPCPLSPPAGDSAPAASGCGAIVPAAPPTAAATRACRAAGSSAAAATGALAAWGKLWPSGASVGVWKGQGGYVGEVLLAVLWVVRGRRARSRGYHALSANDVASKIVMLDSRRQAPRIFLLRGKAARTTPLPHGCVKANLASSFQPVDRSCSAVKAAERMLRRAVGPRKREAWPPSPPCVLPATIGLWDRDGLPRGGRVAPRLPATVGHRYRAGCAAPQVRLSQPAMPTPLRPILVARPHLIAAAAVLPPLQASMRPPFALC